MIPGKKIGKKRNSTTHDFCLWKEAKKKGREGEGDRDESIRARRETETVNYRTGTRQSREPVGRTSSRINRAKSIVRYYYTRWKG